MVYEGQLVNLTTQFACLECGEHANNMLPNSSAFIRYVCRNEKCDMSSVVVTIEKCSNSVFSVFPIYVIDGKPAWPKCELTNFKGETVWPKKEQPSDV